MNIIELAYCKASHQISIQVGHWHLIHNLQRLSWQNNHFYMHHIDSSLIGWHSCEHHNSLQCSASPLVLSTHMLMGQGHHTLGIHNAGKHPSFWNSSAGRRHTSNLLLTSSFFYLYWQHSKQGIYKKQYISQNIFSFIWNTRSYDIWICHKQWYKR